MATHFLTFKKCVLHIYTPRQTSVPEVHENWWKTEEVVRDARFFPNFCHKCRYHGNTLSTTVKKCVLESTPQGKHLCQISWKLVKNWGSSSRRKIFAIFAIRPWQHTFYHCQKSVLHIYTPRHIGQISWEWYLTEEVVRYKIFPPNNMPFMATHFQFSKNVSCTYTPNANICAKFHENTGHKLRK